MSRFLCGLLLCTGVCFAGCAGDVGPDDKALSEEAKSKMKPTTPDNISAMKEQMMGKKDPTGASKSGGPSPSPGPRPSSGPTPTPSK